VRIQWPSLIRNVSSKSSQMLSNACKFTPACVWIRLELNLIATTSLELRVSDSGVGIEGELRGFIFEPFRQGKSSQYGDSASDWQ
jgi:signal transduction histidine kinase